MSEEIKSGVDLVKEEMQAQPSAEVAETPVVAEEAVEGSKKNLIDLPSLPLEDFEVPEAIAKSELNVENEYTGAMDFGVIGSGQCGGRLAKSFYDIGYKKAIAINTAATDLNPLGIPEMHKLKIGEEGSGKSMERGEKATKEAYQLIFDKMKCIFGNVDKIIVGVGFGGGCFAKETKVSLLDGTERTIPEIEKMLESGESVEVYSYDIGNNKHIPKKILWAGETKQNQDMIEIILDNNEKITCTVDHPFLTRSGEYVEARNLKENDSLMPLHRRIDSNGYEQILVDQENWEYTHRVSAKVTYGENYEQEYKTDDDYIVVHHNTFNKRDNRTDKLNLMLSQEHIKKHIEHNKSPEARKKASETMKKTMSTPSMKEWQIEHNRSDLMKKVSGKTISDWNKTEEGVSKIAERLAFMNDPKNKHLRNEWYSSEKIKEVARKNLEEWNASDKAQKQRKLNGKKTASKMETCDICGYKNNIGNVAQHKKREHSLINHKIKSVRFLKEKQNVYDLTVEGYHNFALSAGVVVHNTGSGGLSTLIEIAQKYLEFLGHPEPKTDVIVLAALPTAGELNSTLIADNNKRIKDTMFETASKSEIGPLLLIDNSRIEKLYKGIPVSKFWPTINDTITGLFQLINYMAIQETEYTTFDREDYNTLLKTPGLAVMGVTKIDLSKLKLSQALQENFKKTLLSGDADYKTAKNAGCIVVADTKSIENTSMDDINYGFDTIANLIGNATVYRGVYEASADGVRAYTFIAGMLPS